MFVPVKTKDGQQLMPQHAARARKLVRRGEATPYWDNGIYCICLNKEPSDRETQEITVGVDPGSKKEGFTVKSETHTYLNVQTDAQSQVGQKVEKRRELRRSRRSTAWLTRFVFLQAHAPVGTGNFASLTGFLNSTLLRISV